MRIHFQTRQVMPALPARIPRISGRGSSTTLSRESAAATPPLLFRFLRGLDDAPRPMSHDDISSLGDLFSREVLLKGEKPLTLRALLDTLSRTTSPALPIRKMFLVAEGAAFRTSPVPFELNSRLVFTWQASESIPANALLSTVAVADDPTSLMQIIAWSEHDRAFHYFERKNGEWFWAGNSFHALDMPTRGQGPFDSHINGSLVMKELKRPWTHWHSMNSSIPREVFGNGEFNANPIFRTLDGAELLENIVRTGVRRWTKSRVAAETRADRLVNLPKYMRQILWCTAVNLTSSRDVYSNQTVASFDLPSSFFFDVDAFSFLGDELGNAELIPPLQFEVDASLYRNAIKKKGVEVADEATPPHRVSGDTHFAFLVPERAFEDQVVLNELILRGILSQRLALCLLMVDFANPVFSPERAALLRYFPDSTTIGSAGAALDRIVIDAIREVDAPDRSPESALLKLWDTTDLVEQAIRTLASYATAIARRLQTQAGVDDIVDLAESRRHAFASKRSLAEFNSTLAHGRRPPEHLAMRPDGTVFTKPSDVGEEEL
jgi:hypothetical protein